MALTPLKAYPNFGTQHLVPTAGYPATVADGATWQSDLLPAGFSGATAGILSDHGGTLTLQRYADLAGVLPVGALISQAVTANVSAWVGANDGLPFLSFNVEFINGAGAIANIESLSILTGPTGGF